VKILLIECNDELGIIARVTTVLLKFKLNLVEFHEFADEETNQFYMRAGVTGELDQELVGREILAVLPKDASFKFVEGRKKKVVIMVTKENHCLGDLLLRHYTGNLDMEILGVIGNHPDCKDLTDKFNIPWFEISHKGIERTKHEELITKKIIELNPDFVLLAKFMRILSPEFVAVFPNKIINIHHSFLPSFIGANPYRQAYERGVKIIGATAHFVNNDLDEGPIIYQDVIRVDHSHSALEMSRSGRDVEKRVFTKGIKLVLRDRVFVSKNRTIVFA
jgi:formyltetrahydrofolate deformylase